MTTNSSATTEQQTPYAAIAMVVATYFLFACNDAAGKYLVLSGLDPVLISWCRFTIQGMFVLLIFGPGNIRAAVTVRNLPIQTLRAILLFMSNVLMVTGLRHLQLVEATAIHFSAPLVIAILAGPLLGEWMGIRRTIAVIVGFLGVLVVLRPGFANFGFGHLCVVGAMLSYCFFLILTRRIGSSETTASLLFMPAFVSCILIGPLLPFYSEAPSQAVQFGLLLLVGIFSALGHWILLKAFRLAPASSLMPYSYSQIISVTAFGYLIFGQLPDLWTAVGTVIVVSSGLYLIHRERLLRIVKPPAPLSV